MPRPVQIALLALLAAGLGAWAPAARAQEAGGAENPTGAENPARVASLMAAHERAERAHLWRVAVWGSANLAAGAALMLASGRNAHPARFGFGLQSGIWGAVNVGIAGVGLAGSGGEPSAPAEAAAAGAAIEAVRGYHDILLLNIGLNVAYAGVGTTLLVAGYRDVRSAGAWRGHGTALIVQGAGLLLLDGIALWGARGRLAGLLDLAAETTLTVGPAGARLLVRL